MSLFVGSTRLVLARQPAVLAPSTQVLRAFSLRSERPGQPGICARSPPGALRLFPPRRVVRAARGLAPFPLARCAFSLHGERPGQPEVWRPLHGSAAPLPSAAPARRQSGLRKSLDRNRGLFARWEGVASLGLSLPLSPPPSSYLQRGWGGSSLEFLSPFVLRITGGVFRPVNFSSLSHSLKKLPPTALRAFWPVPTLRNAAGSSPFARSCWWRVQASGVLFCWELLLGT